MKKTLLITEEERKRISILHENAIKRQHLVEQAPPQFQYNAAQMLNAGKQNTQNLAPVNQNDLNTAFINKTNQQYVNSGNNTAADPNTTTTTTKAPATSNNTSKSNPKVAQIQKKLMDMGYSQLLGAKRDDGVLGPKTLDAILTALSSSEKLTTNMATNQPKIQSPTATAEIKPSAINEPQKTPVNATRGGSGMAQIAADDAKQAQVTAAQPAATGGNTPQVTNQVANKTKEQPKNTQDFDNEIE